MRTDPSDNGGLFVGRRPGTAPIRYRDAPRRGDERRRRLDDVLAGAILVVMGIVTASFWGPIPTAWLWVGGQTQFRTDSVGAAILVAFLGMLFTLLAGLVVLRGLDQAWILVRRAAGHDQRKGMIGPVFAVATIIGASTFTFWLLFIGGLGPTIAPSA